MSGLRGKANSWARTNEVLSWTMVGDKASESEKNQSKYMTKNW